MAKRLFKVVDRPATWIEVDDDKTPEELAKLKEYYEKHLTLKGLKESGYFKMESSKGTSKVNPKQVCMDEVSIRDCMNNIGYKW